MFFMGTYTPKLDEKGRLILPAKFRDRLSEGLVVTQGQEKCLDVFPSDVFVEEADRARAGADLAERRATRSACSSSARGGCPTSRAGSRSRRRCGSTPRSAATSS